MSPQSQQRPITLREVAEAAEVSISTASRILDDRTPPSRSATAQKVREVAERLGYRRNVFAASLRRGATGMIGVLVPRLTDTVMAMMYQAIERAARRRGFFAVVATCGDDPDDEAHATETLLDRNVDAVVLATARLDDELPASLRRRRIRHALVLRTDGVSPSSLGEDETGGYLAVRHLLDLGHERIGIITGPSFTSSGQERRRGAERALQEAGVQIEPGSVRSVGYGIDDGAQAARELLAQEQRPTAIFAANDNLAIGVQSAAIAQGLSIGRELSVVGYNDIPLVSKLPVPLTSVHTNFDQIAATAMDLVSEANRPGQIVRSLPTLIPRASTGRPNACF